MFDYILSCMKTPRKRIQKLLSEVRSAGRSSKGDVVALFASIRSLIEENNLQNNYPMSNFYCNWLLHTKLEKRDPVFGILFSITKALVDHWSESSGMVLEISKAFRVNDFREELQKLFSQYDIDDFLFGELKNWNSIFSALIENFSDKPIQFPENVKLNGKSEADKVFTAAHGLAGGNDLKIARKVWVTEEEKGDINLVHWVIETRPKVTYQGRFLNNSVGAHISNQHPKIDIRPGC